MQRYTASYALVFGLGLLVRVLLILYGEWHDRHLAVKYTDIDYFVYSDAAIYITKGQSPYLRATYRYTPLLAILLTPNVYVSCFGKLIFTTADMLAGCATHSLLRSRTSTPLRYTCLWLFNPLVFNMSSRGSADGLLIALLLGTMWCLEANRPTLGAVLYGLCVHLRIYPVIYGPAFVLFLSLGCSDSALAVRTLDMTSDNFTEKETHTTTLRRRKPLSVHASNLMRINHPIRLNACSQLKSVLSDCFTLRTLWFFCISAGTFTALAVFFYSIYGQEFLDETYFYHFGRKDTRHNFSLYFYHMYLSASLPSSSTLAFLPQFLLATLFTCKFYRDIAFCVFLQTYCFVVFNKVCTAQYFLWYIGLLPLIVSRLSFSRFQAGLLVVLWALGEGHWLFWAYRLEFLGLNTFREVWVASVLFFIINITIISIVIHYYRPEKWNN